MKVKTKQISAPRTVYPRSVQHHGLLGTTFVKQHMMIDEHWTTDSLKQEFEMMTLLLNKHAKFNDLEKKVQQSEIMKTSRMLQKQCRDGRSNLKLLRAGSLQEVRNILKNHPAMQRLYQKMPLHLAVENINQRTFVMRKERDRLQSRLLQLENVYEEKLRDKGEVENRISYKNEFKLEEDVKVADLMKKLENSKMRLQANMTVNSTYQKIIQILQHDETFYLPILRSLNKDIEDQSQFIKHILHLGSPALERFQELGIEYKLLHDKARRSSRHSLTQCTKYRRMLSKPFNKEAKRSTRDIYYKIRHYVRETRSMRDLKAKFEEIEETIKQIKIATICSNEKDIYPRIKSQMNNNLNMGSRIENDMLSHEVLQTKMRSSSVLQEVLINNFNEDERMRLEKIKSLKEAIEGEDEFQKNTLAHIKSDANIFVLLRLSLWNLHEIMRYVGPRQIPRIEYPVNYLKLPLLTYEMLQMKAYPPDAFEQSTMKLLKEVHLKLRRLTKAFNWELSETSINLLKKSFCDEMLQATDVEVLSMSGQEMRYQIDMETETNPIEEVKYYRKIPTRNDIKLTSARLVEEYIKKDE